MTKKKNWYPVRGLGWMLFLLFLVITLSVGCESFRTWRDKKAMETEGSESVTVNQGTTSTGEKKKLRSNPPVPRPAGSIGSAILMVNRDSLTADEVLRRVRPQLEATALTYSEDVYKRRAQELLSNNVRDMISETLLYQEISARITEDQNPVVEKAVDKEVLNLATLEAGGSKVLLEKMLAAHGSTMEDLRKQLRRQIVTQQYLRERMKPKVMVTRDNLWEYYQGHQDDFLEPASVHLLLIEIDAEKFLPKETPWSDADSMTQSNARSKAQSQLKSALAKLANGEDFATAAKEFSTATSGRVGGDMGWISKGSYRLKQLEDEAFNLNIGLVSRPITIENTIYLVKSIGFKPEKKITFTEAQDKIRGILEQDLYRRLVMEHLKTLWDKAQIGSVDYFLESVYARLPAYETLRVKKGK
ncbi:MAG: peptidylprolyl isomerase [Phycisphaerae bacterium]